MKLFRGAIRSELLRFFTMLSVLVVITVFEVRALFTLKNPLLLFLSIVAYLLFVPSFIVTVTLWREIRTSITEALTKTRREEEHKVVGIIARSMLLYYISRAHVLKNIFNRYALALANYAEEAAVAIDPLNTAALSIIIAVYASALTLLSLYYLLRVPIVIALAATLLVSSTVLSSPLLVLKMLASSRRGAIKLELPFFVLYASLVEKAGKSLAVAFERIANRSYIFRRLSREAQYFLKIATFFEPSPLRALNTYSSTLPNKEFSSIIQDYLSVAQTGGNTARFLETTSERILQMHVAEWNSYVEKVGFFGDVLISLFVLLPSIMVLGAIAFSQSMSVLMLQIFTYAVTPLMAIAIYLVVDSMQPKYPTASLFSKTDKVVVPVCSVAGMFMVIMFVNRFRIEFPLALSLIALVVLLPPLGVYIMRSIEVKSVDRDLPRFLRDVAESLRVGYTFAQALPRIAQSRHYNKFLDRYINVFAVLTQLNVPIMRFQQRLMTRSWLFNYALFVLYELEELGALSPREIELLARFIETIEGSKRRARGALSLYSILFVMAPMFILMLMLLTQSMLSTVKSVGYIQILNPQLVMQVVSLTKILAVILAVFLGILAGKIRDGTGLNVLYAVISLAIVCATLALGPQLGAVLPMP